MKIRKGLLAAATAATVSISGMTVPAFADETNAVAPSSTGSTVNGSSAGGDANTEGENGEEQSSVKDIPGFIKENSSDKDGNWDPNQIKLWIGVFTAIITALGALFTFIDKNFKK